jgi:hypothetical protein
MQGVYFIHAPELTQKSLFKIGWSTDINRRVRELQTGNGMKLEVYNTIYSDDPSLETRIQKALKNYRKQGEWFEITMDQVDVIIDVINEFVHPKVPDSYNEIYKVFKWWEEHNIHLSNKQKMLIMNKDERAIPILRQCVKKMETINGILLLQRAARHDKVVIKSIDNIKNW